MAALEVHKHLYLEKPIGRTKEDVAAVMRASQTSRGLLQLGFQLRYDPRRSAAVRHVREGGIGRIAYMAGGPAFRRLAAAARRGTAMPRSRGT